RHLCTRRLHEARGVRGERAPAATMRRVLAIGMHWRLLAILAGMAICITSFAAATSMTVTAPPFGATSMSVASCDVEAGIVPTPSPGTEPSPPGHETTLTTPSANANHPRAPTPAPTSK